jgi:hypothetical protein
MEKLRSTESWTRIRGKMTVSGKSKSGIFSGMVKSLDEFLANFATAHSS